MFLALDHPSIACRDVAQLAAWYCKNLGMRIIATNNQDPPALLVGYANDLKGAAMIEMMPATDSGPRVDEIKRFAPGIRHLALRVSDFEQAYAQLLAIGTTFTTKPGEALGGGRTVLFRDPEGNELQIVQR